jgi:hypothetical protein
MRNLITNVMRWREKADVFWCEKTKGKRCGIREKEDNQR